MRRWANTALAAVDTLECISGGGIPATAPFQEVEMTYELILEFEGPDGVNTQKQPMPGLEDMPRPDGQVWLFLNGVAEEWRVVERRIEYAPEPTAEQPEATHCVVTVRCQPMRNPANN
jgi:hypothetical protein